MLVKSQASRIESLPRSEEPPAAYPVRRGCHPTFRLPPSALRRRAAISLTEVLISMGILTLGLLGVAALFPVGGHYMQQAEIADRGSAIAQAVMSDIITRGMLNPASWFVMVPAAGNGKLRAFDGSYTPVSPTSSRGTFTRPFTLSLNQALSETQAITDPTYITKEFGAAYVIDPMAVAAIANPSNSNSNRNYVVNSFPSGLGPSPALNYWSALGTYGWSASTWGQMFPVRRVTFRQPDTAWQMDAVSAESFFRGSDDLATDLPQRDDRPAVGRWDLIDTDNDGKADTPLARQWAGDYSWIVSVVPTTTAARDGLARNPEGFAYDVSVVVFHKRVLPSSIPADTQETARAAAFERTVLASVVTTGLNGGELLLTKLSPDNVTESPFKFLKAGQWIMLCGPHPNSNANVAAGTGELRFELNWYQVLSIDTEGTGISGFNASTQRVVAVRGPEWPWRPYGDLTDRSALSNNLCVGIFQGAVAVHTKTMRLESPRMSSVSFGGGSRPDRTPKPYVNQ